MRRKSIKKSTLFRKLGAFVGVDNMISKNGYSNAPNQFVIYFKHGTMFKSYKSIVAVWYNGNLYVDEFYHDYSRTTMRFCKQYTGLDVIQRRKGIENGTIKTFE